MTTIIEQYPTLAARTAGNLDIDAALIDGALGLCGEAGEVMQLLAKPYNYLPHLPEEITDWFWYVGARWCAVYGWDFAELIKYEPYPIYRLQWEARHALMHCALLADLVKKAHVKARLQGGAIRNYLDEAGARNHIRVAARSYQLILINDCKMTLADALPINVVKLEKRHDDGNGGVLFNPDYTKAAAK